MSVTTNARVKNKLLIDREIYLVCGTTWFQGGRIAFKMWGVNLKKPKNNKKPQAYQKKSNEQQSFPVKVEQHWFKMFIFS